MFYISTMVCVNSIKTAGMGFIKSAPIRFTSQYSSQLTVSGCDCFVSTAKGMRNNPLLDAIKKAVPFEKEPRYKIADNLHDIISDITKVESEAVGKDAKVFSIPGYEDLVLRVEKSALEKSGDLKSDLELVPIFYDKTVEQNAHLGLPLYFVASKSSTIAKKNRISPLEALAQPDKIMVLRRVSGQHPAYDCWEKFISLIGFDSKNPDTDALNNFSFIFGYVARNFGYEPTKKCLEMFKDGATEIPAHALAEGSAPFKIVNGKQFFNKYKEFTSSYIDYLKKVSDMPQSAYDDAVKFVAEPKSFNVDFQHTNNTFVDFEKNEFNFMDFAFDKTDEKYIYENPVKEFRNVLLGKSFISLDALRTAVRCLPSGKYPRSYIYCPEDIEAVKNYSKIINEKINIAAPKELKSENPFR